MINNRTLASTKEGEVMKIGIIVHSQSGNTYSVAEKLKEGLAKEGHQVTLSRIRNRKEPKELQKPKDIELDRVPETEGYDVLIFGAWVQAFSLCPGFIAYLDHVPALEERKVLCFVTQHFPFKWMGGSRALRKMSKLIEVKGGRIGKTAVVNWSAKGRNQQIDRLVTDFGKELETQSEEKIIRLV